MYQHKDGIKRDCPDFRGQSFVNGCTYTHSCNPIEQGMYFDVIQAKVYVPSHLNKCDCTGINNPERFEEVKKICRGKALTLKIVVFLENRDKLGQPPLRHEFLSFSDDTAEVIEVVKRENPYLNEFQFLENG